MRMTLRWFGEHDPVTLDRIRQIPGVVGIVAALYHRRPGEVWPADEIERLRDAAEAAGLALDVIESIPVHEDVKLGRPTRDRYADAFAESLRRVAGVGCRTVCYNFMPVFDWTRTNLRRPLPDGSFSLAYSDEELARMDLAAAELPGWLAGYTREELDGLFEAYRGVEPERLWDHLAWFLERVVPVAEEAGVRLGIHPDDPCWPILGLPRIVTSGPALERLVRLVDSPSNGVTLCTGSLGCAPENDLPAIARSLAGRIAFVHMRNVRITGAEPGARAFHEAAHPTAYGSVDMGAVMRALIETGFDGPVRPDHGRDIWGERGRPGYGLHDRALGAAYLLGLAEGLGRPFRMPVPGGEGS